MTETPIECPTCHGAKLVYALVRYADEGCKPDMIQCSTCAGEGTITERYRLALEEGDRLRDERLQRGESLREMAKRLGMSPVELSAKERGTWAR